ncbi:MAG: MogA/MoaB family molybdenum cofactor biosynthesis protein [Thermoplasmata archaeon]|jgi:molybdenum cofactor biosynthesis protein B|nr:MogA/MoaB family molybdenum cofactor biosynthesis protein [Thermoplasmata archaeon]
MSVEDHKSKAPKSVNLAIITVSDTRTEADDSSGMAIADIMARAGHIIVRRAIVKDEVEEIQKALRELIEDTGVQAVVINGGTGIARRDVTLEAITPFQEKSIPGFGELFRVLSFNQVGSAAMMSRASAFVTEGKIVFCLPGSEKAVRLAVEKLIAPELGHMVWEAQR